MPKYLLLSILVTFATFHLLKSLLKLWAWSNTARREACVKMKTTWLQKKMQEWGRKLTCSHVGHFADIPLAHIGVKLFGVQKH